MKSNYRNAVWYLCTLSISIFTITILSTVQGASRTIWALTVFITLLQVAGLAYYLHIGDKTSPFGIRFALILLKFSAFAVISLLLLAVYVIASQYHNPVEPTTGETITIAQTDKLYIMYPSYDTVEFVTETRPSRSDKTISYMSAAAFQRTYNLFFTHDEIAGKHVEKGVLYNGYELENLGAFTFYDGNYYFSNKDEAEASLQEAVEHGGYGFQQRMIIDDGVIIAFPLPEYRCYRALAELDNRLCVIDSRSQIDFKEFTMKLKQLGVTHAFYLDMGSGWNYSWYRNNNGKTQTLIGLPWPFSHNWIAFRTQSETEY